MHPDAQLGENLHSPGENFAPTRWKMSKKCTHLNTKCTQLQKKGVVFAPTSYYVCTTNESYNLPYFAVICRMCRNLPKWQYKKHSRQSAVKLGISRHYLTGENDDSSAFYLPRQGTNITLENLDFKAFFECEISNLQLVYNF